MSDQQPSDGDAAGESDEDEIILADLSDEDLTAQMHDDLYDGLGDEITDGTNILLERGWSADTVSYTHLTLPTICSV